ncbi:class I SAM-dependent methyltransferase [Phragmitibacter flavus]|uniref:Class I SAM-dependent methyltransferase n=1 Tax=Phragmitibacter flavus TaxID=2576071 RepID=A0A5R8K7V4_9BACT|nr:class I SAM-dependent methyltransferase [Phragmitibacter flavus]TLD68418.1 class I SAM-dependent methyltransferase [Phragmitibacter flavus]
MEINDMNDEVEMQRRYYADKAERYDDAHVHEDDEHFFGLSFLEGVLEYLKADSVLDVGSGTGRAMGYLMRHRPGLRVAGIEPVQELREVGYAQGIPKDCLLDGDATKLPYAAGEFDVVCAFGVLHHIRQPELAIAEMLRVAGKAIFISDANNFGRGSRLGRLMKQSINSLGLWKLAALVLSKGKGYVETPGDGISYSYSVFNNYRQIKQQCRSVHLLNTTPGDINPYRSASHVALLGIKK